MIQDASNWIEWSSKRCTMNSWLIENCSDSKRTMYEIKWNIFASSFRMPGIDMGLQRINTCTIGQKRENVNTEIRYSGGESAKQTRRHRSSLSSRPLRSFPLFSPPSFFQILLQLSSLVCPHQRPALVFPEAHEAFLRQCSLR